MKNSNPLQNREILSRLKVAKGHVAAVMNMIEEDKSCEEILLQLDAIRASMLKISVFVAQHYAETCLLDALDNGDKRRENLNKSIETLMRVNQYCCQPNLSFSEASATLQASK
ncbi:Metal-sensitive transcriptional repressor [Acididesulfobacillus acetoxydans]|uniref:Metal-sensitive transcriptional repressor n=1 Tax=Acididesulfobacillus acetoxydans TaxID=1561005 RepID=A0A8S0XVL3_9FIRM|nr:metal-sensitive transcriptional regulator [Acididesulfobacillus acetoxydans]CAA7600437.1 Metal-sensitive transcriptional repressor [Acididesulfobacillus acetoxydans]CEJ06571.1 Metal-sensitive transcriptional repressor [Acididesulfobacillus acetoxydans]